MKKWLLIGLVGLLTLADVHVASAQREERGEREARRDRMRTFLVLRISEALDLPETKSLEISKILRDAEAKRQELLTQRRDVERQLREAMGGGGAPDATLTPFIAQANELDGQIAMIAENSFRQVQDVLSVEQRAQLVLLRPELQSQIRRNVQRRMRAR
jgi:hypothetical protein